MAATAPTSLPLWRTSALALTLLLAASGCAAAEGTSAEPAGNEQSSAASEEAAASDVNASQYLDELYSDALHDGIEPAAAGTAYIEAAGERFEFAELACSLNETPGASRLEITATAETTGSGHKLYLKREIGADIGFNFENEHVQLAYFVPAGNGRDAKFSNALAQHSRDEGEAPDWFQGSGESPLLHIVGAQVTATGTFNSVAYAPDSDGVSFIVAATCP